MCRYPHTIFKYNNRHCYPVCSQRLLQSRAMCRTFRTSLASAQWISTMDDNRQTPSLAAQTPVMLCVVKKEQSSIRCHAVRRARKGKRTTAHRVWHNPLPVYTRMSVQKPASGHMGGIPPGVAAHRHSGVLLRARWCWHGDRDPGRKSGLFFCHIYTFSACGSLLLPERRALFPCPFFLAH
jgi:hypothetical protein